MRTTSFGGRSIFALSLHFLAEAGERPVRRAERRSLCVVLALLAAAFAFASASFAQTAPDPAAKLIEQAGQHHDKREWKAAIGDATEALKLAPNSADAYTIRGDA